MRDCLLNVENLSVCYPSDQAQFCAVRQLSFCLEKGGRLGIIGESGSGKTSLALAMMGLLPPSAEVKGTIWFRQADLNGLSEKEWNRYRWGKIAMVFQNGMEVLNPVLTVQEQVMEAILQHTPLPVQEANRKASSLLGMVGLDPGWGRFYPHQLSGGMRQRVLLAMAISCDPEVLIVDEPTNALDAIAKEEMTKLLEELHREKKFALILISHEMEIVAKLTDRVMVIYAGEVMEEGETSALVNDPMHPYTRGIIQASPSINPYRDLWGIPGESLVTPQLGCPFFSRCNQSLPECSTKPLHLEPFAGGRRVACHRGGIVTLLSGEGIYKRYRFKGEVIKACEDCSIKVRSGEVVLLLGESGSGKTTLASILSGILKADRGEVLFEGKKVKGNWATSRRRGLQMVFQDPFTSINENLTVAQVIREPLELLKEGSLEERNEKVVQALFDARLPGGEDFLSRKVYTLSGGQRQRVALARSLVMEPQLLIADEISAMLDPSTQANIIRLLKGLQNEKGFAMLYITHDLALARKIADRIYVMYGGRVIEQGSVVEVFESPKEPYTRRLIGSLS